MAKIEKKKLPEKVIDEIRNRLETGEIKIGDKLPNQNELSLDLGVSRTSLREAMKMLDLLGVIEQRPGYGTVIQAMIPELQVNNAALELLSDPAATFELLEAREIIECGSVRLAARKATGTQIETMSRLVDEMEEMLKDNDYEGYRKSDYRFHELIIDTAQNRFLDDPANTLRTYVQQFIEENTMLLPGLLKESHQHHRAICNSIATGDPDRAEKAMRLHIQTIAKSYRQFQTSTGTRR